MIKIQNLIINIKSFSFGNKNGTNGKGTNETKQMGYPKYNIIIPR